MSITSRISSIEEHISEAYDELQGLGADLTGIDKNIDNIADVLDDIYDDLPKISGEGTSLNLNNTRVGKLETTLKGNTSQTGTPTPSSPIPVNVVSGDNSVFVEGKNLYNYQNTNQVTSGIVVDDNGWITIEYNNTTANTTNFNYYPKNLNLIPGEQYTIVCEVAEYTYSSSHLMATSLYYTNPTQGQFTTDWDINSSELQVGTFTAVRTCAGYEHWRDYPNYNNGIRTYFAVPSGDSGKIKFRLSVIKKTNIVASDFVYVPYSGNTYNIDLPVENLFDKNNATYSSNNTGLNADGDEVSSSGYQYTTSYTNVLPATQYTIQGTFNSSSHVTRIYYYTKNNEWISRSDTFTTSPYTFTTPNNCGKIRFLLYSSLYDEDTIQIELGKANTYTPYGTTPIELCKIGNYQDYFWHYKVNSKLPSDYTQVEYIASTGTQYIDTGVSPTTSTGVDIKASLTTENNSGKILFGSRVGQNRFWFDFDGTQSSPYFMYGFGSYYQAGNYSPNTIYDISYNYNGTKVLKINNNSYSMSGTYDSTSSVPIYLFRANYSTAFAGNFKIYECKIYEGTTLLRNLVPCIRNNDNKVGMYDLVNNVFYTNQGTGEFTYGKVNGNWYKCGYINKIKLDKNKNWQYISVTQGSLFRTNNTITDNYQDGNIVPFSNYYKGISFTNSQYRANNEFYIQNNMTYLDIIDNRYTSLGDFNTFINDNSVFVYYVLATPTTTQITYQPLIEQLNNLEKAMSYNGQTNISQVNNDLPFIISASALLDASTYINQLEAEVEALS